MYGGNAVGRSGLREIALQEGARARAADGDAGAEGGAKHEKIPVVFTLFDFKRVCVWIHKLDVVLEKSKGRTPPSAGRHRRVCARTIHGSEARCGA